MNDEVLSILSEADRERFESMGFGRQIGFGQRTAVILIDVQNYMVGPPRGSVHHYPSACPGAPEAVDRIAELLDAARTAGAPVFYTRFELARDGSDAGIYRAKRGLPDTEGWCLEGSEGAEILADVAPHQGDFVFVKKKPSAFVGTPLLGYLIDLKVDTLVVVGGATSNCVRATVVDGASLNFRMIVPKDAVFDRFQISHEVALFDIQRQFGDVVAVSDVTDHLRLERTGANDV
jgi:nicotinamidase-related amidase